MRGGLQDKAEQSWRAEDSGKQERGGEERGEERRGEERRELELYTRISRSSSGWRERREMLVAHCAPRRRDDSRGTSLNQRIYSKMQRLYASTS
jgi:hypothetical protein